METIKGIINEHKEYWNQLGRLAVAEIERTYRGAALGWSWAIIKPAVTIFVYWFAFEIGLRHSKPVDGFPFFLWLIAGICPWFYMSEMITGGANCIRKHSNLVTKMKFPVSTIPTFVSLGRLIVHLGILFVIMIVFCALGYMPDIYWLQLPFYSVMMFLFFTMWAMFSGMISAMSKDFLNLIKSLTTAIFWLSGVLWDPRTLKIRWLKRVLKFNPVTYFAGGYRNVFIYKTWFWENKTDNIGFFIVFALMLIFSIWAYKKLRKDIPDVL